MNWLKETLSRIGLLSFAMFVVVLPPRPEPPPAPAPAQSAAIELNVSGLSAEMQSTWTRVQWLAGDGTWVTAQGWLGAIEFDSAESSGTQHWAVGSELYGQANFRWQLLDGEGGTVLATSDTFSMPTRNGQIVTVSMTIQ